MYTYTREWPGQLPRTYVLGELSPGSDVRGLQIPCIYGKWCGPGCSGPGVPIDDLDACCQTHDQCYGRRGYFNCQCDRDLVSCVAPKRDLTTKKGRSALAVWTYFKAAPCRR